MKSESLERTIPDPAAAVERDETGIRQIPKEIQTVAYPTTNEVTRTPGKALKVTLWMMQILHAAAFGALGALKLGGATMMIAKFEMIGLAQWLRYLTGLLEVAGAVALAEPGTAFYGAALLATVMVGAIIAHFAVLGISTPFPAFILVVLTGTVAYFTTVGRSNTRAELCSCPEHIQARPDCEAAAPVTMAIIG
jgi:hypothetical protein